MVSDAQLEIAILSVLHDHGFKEAQRETNKTAAALNDLMASATQLNSGIMAVTGGLQSFGIINEGTAKTVQQVGEGFMILQGIIRTCAAAYDIAKIAAIAFQAASGPIGWICLAIAAVVTLLIAMWQDWGGINAWLISGIRQLGDALVWLYDHTIKPLIEGIRWLIDGFKELSDWIGGALKGLSFDFTW